MVNGHTSPETSNVTDLGPGKTSSMPEGVGRLWPRLGKETLVLGLRKMSGYSLLLSEEDRNKMEYQGVWREGPDWGTVEAPAHIHPSVQLPWCVFPT